MALNPNIAMQAQGIQYDPSVGMQTENALMTNELNRLKYASTRQQMETQQRINALMQANPEAVMGPDGTPNYNALAQIAMAGGDPQAAMGYSEAAADARQGQATYDKTVAETETTKAEQAIKELETVGRAMGAVKDESTYMAARDFLLSQDPDYAQLLPETYQPGLEKQIASMSMTYKDQISQQMDQAKFAETQRHNRATEGNQAPIQVADPTSPTGRRYVSRSEAMGQAAPDSGMSLSVGPDGEVNFSTGGASGLGNRAQNEAETKLLGMGDTLMQVTRLAERFKPQYQTIGGKAAGNVWLPLKDKFAKGSLTQEEQAYLEDFTNYRAEAGQLFSSILKDLSGVAVNPTEFKRAEAYVPNPGTGMFDGDSPTQLKSKSERFVDFYKKAMARYAYVTRKGMNIGDVKLNDVPQLMQKRGNQLSREYKKQGMEGAELREAVKSRLAQEFGLTQ